MDEQIGDGHVAVMKPSTSTDPAEAALSFESFFDAEAPRLFRAARLLTGSHHEAEELCQEAFFKVWQRWDRVSTMESPSGYLYRTVMNDYRKWYRRALLATRHTVKVASPDDPQLTVQARDTFVRWLTELTPRQRSAVILIEMLTMSTEEAAIAMHVKPGTIHVLISQARASLRSLAESDDV